MNTMTKNDLPKMGRKSAGSGMINTSVKRVYTNDKVLASANTHKSKLRKLKGCLRCTELMINLLSTKIARATK